MTRPKTVLLVDDDPDLRALLLEQLEATGEFAPVEAATAGDGVAKAISIRPEIIILDVDLPDMDGRDACRQMRAAGVSAPIVMLTGKDGDSDAVHGLESGANDYVTKPFKFAVLAARLRAHLRTQEQAEAASFIVGPYEFRPAQRLLLDAKGTKLRLTDKEASILRYLHRAGGKPVAREELLREVWGYNAGVTTHTLETHVYRLRQKIEPEPGRARLLVTEQGGYRLQA
jgi:DNA-binding response OmpR family regulator